MRYIKNILIVILLTALTQVGGLVYIVYLAVRKQIFKFHRSKRGFFFLRFFGFPIFYLLVIFFIIPPIALIFNRKPLPYRTSTTFPIQATHFLYCLANRHYVDQELYNVLQEASIALNEPYSDFKLTYLDAGFPLWDDFPMLPHLSHGDGKKIDLLFVYYDLDQKRSYYGPISWLGYGVYEKPKKGESNYPNICHQKGYWQYNFISRFFPISPPANLTIDLKKTRRLIQVLCAQNSVRKVFIEPHLRDRLKVQNIRKVRFHGCHAIRHDDHIHLEL